MGILYDYFAAPNDAIAAMTIDRPGGPGELGAPALTKSPGPFGRGQDAEPLGGAVAFPTVSDTGVDPVVQGGTLEELFTGRAYEQIEDDPRWAQSLASRNGGERLVLTLTDGLVDALAHATDEQLAAVTVPWSEAEGFWGAGDPSVLTSLLIELSELCRDAVSRGERVYAGSPSDLRSCRVQRSCRGVRNDQRRPHHRARPT